MKKTKLKTILIILTTIVICLSVGVYAGYTLSATDVNYTKSDGTTLSVKAALDELNSNIPLIGDERTVGEEVTVGGEQFYVLKWNGEKDEATLLAKYNLNSDGTAQSSSAVRCVFSSTNYWSSSYTSSPFNLNNCSGYTSTDAMGKAKSYGESKGAVSSRLLSYEEANALKTKSKSNSKIKSMHKNGQNYWLGSANGTKFVYYVSGGNGNLSTDIYYRSDAFGVRPVITVLKSSIS